MSLFDLYFSNIVCLQNSDVSAENVSATGTSVPKQLTVPPIETAGGSTTPAHVPGSLPVARISQ